MPTSVFAAVGALPEWISRCGSRRGTTSSAGTAATVASSAGTSSTTSEIAMNAAIPASTPAPAPCAVGERLAAVEGSEPRATTSANGHGERDLRHDVRCGRRRQRGARVGAQVGADGQHHDGQRQWRRADGARDRSAEAALDGGRDEHDGGSGEQRGEDHALTLGVRRLRFKR
jgi:hypothetical protein